MAGRRAPTAPMPVLAHQLRWYITIRVLVISSVLLLYGLAQLTWWGGTPDPVEIGPTGVSVSGTPAGTPAVQPAPPPPAPVPEALPPRFVLGLAGLTFALTLLYLALYQLLGGRYPLQAYVQFGGDLLLVSVLVHGSGGLASPFSMLYLIVIAVASTLLRRRVGVTVASAAYLLYLLLVLVPYQGDLPHDGWSALLGEGRLFYNLIAHLLGFYAVAFLTSYLARDVTRAERELEAKSEDLADLQVVHRDVIESITSGLITTDLDGLITSVNRAGQKILRRAEAELVGSPIQESGLLPPEPWARLTAASELKRRLRSEAEIAVGGNDRAFVGFSVS